MVFLIPIVVVAVVVAAIAVRRAAGVPWGLIVLCSLLVPFFFQILFLVVAALVGDRNANRNLVVLIPVVGIGALVLSIISSKALWAAGQHKRSHAGHDATSDAGEVVLRGSEVVTEGGPEQPKDGQRANQRPAHSSFHRLVRAFLLFIVFLSLLSLLGFVLVGPRPNDQEATVVVLIGGSISLILSIIISRFPWRRAGLSS